MRREPPSRQRRVALARIHVYVSINVLVFAVNNRFSLVRFVRLQWVVRTKSVGIDCQRLLLVVIEEESHGRFVGGFRRDDVSLIAAAINEDKHWWLVFVVTSSSTFRQATRARRSVALAAFLPGRDVELIDLNWANEINVRRVERFGEALDALVKRPVGDIKFSVYLADTRVEPEQRVEREQQLIEADLRVREDRAGLVVERASTIFTAIPLILSIAAVLDHRFRLAARALEALAPTNLLQQVRGARLRTKHFNWEHSRAMLTHHLCPLRFRSASSVRPTICFRRAVERTSVPRSRRIPSHWWWTWPRKLSRA